VLDLSGHDDECGSALPRSINPLPVATRTEFIEIIAGKVRPDQLFAETHFFGYSLATP